MYICNYLILTKGVQPRQALMFFSAILHPMQFIDLLLKYLYIYNNGSNKIVVVVVIVVYMLRFNFNFGSNFFKPVYIFQTSLFFLL